MKARSKAQKLKRRKGRPKMEGVPREPNGRPSRAVGDAVDVVALEARRRHLGLPKEKARDQKAGSYIGCLNLMGKRDGLSDDQYEAAIQYLHLRQAYLRAINAPGRVIDGDGAGSAVLTEAYEKWARDTKEAYGNCRAAIQAAQDETRAENLWAALDLIVIQDQRLPHMIGATRVLCNALARFFKL